MKFRRVFIALIDSVGVGELKDADKYGDTGANTLKNIAAHCGGINLPNMEKMGIGNLDDFMGIKKIDSNAYYTKASQISVGKDTLTGHWEMMGLHIDKPFKVFTDTGFPEDLILEIEKQTGRKVIGNISASGTKIIEDLGKEHVETGSLIVYTSADSVLQIAAHEEIVELDELYDICNKVRKITMEDKWKVARIIARPFIGQYPNFERTSNRHDYALKPYERTVLNELKDASYDVIALGKINDIYNGEGITSYEYTISNDDGMKKITEIAKNDFTGLCFLNLVDFDAKYGHRRDPVGYKNALEDFDVQLGLLVNELREDDLLIITADHGNDPTMPGSDHTREYIPVIMYSSSLTEPKGLDEFETFATIGKTIADNFNVKLPKIGTSILKDLK